MNVVQTLNKTNETLTEVEMDVKVIEKASQNIMELCNGLLGNNKETKNGNS